MGKNKVLWVVVLVLAACGVGAVFTACNNPYFPGLNLGGDARLAWAKVLRNTTEAIQFDSEKDVGDTTYTIGPFMKEASLFLGQGNFETAFGDENTFIILMKPVDPGARIVAVKNEIPGQVDPSDPTPFEGAYISEWDFTQSSELSPNGIILDSRLKYLPTAFFRITVKAQNGAERDYALILNNDGSARIFVVKQIPFDEGLMSWRKSGGGGKGGGWIPPWGGGIWGGGGIGTITTPGGGSWYWDGSQWVWVSGPNNNPPSKKPDEVGPSEGNWGYNPDGTIDPNYDTGSDVFLYYRDLQINKFDIAQFETTNQLWNDVIYGTGMPNTSVPVYSSLSARSGADEEPVINVSWYEAVVWCNMYSERMHLEPVYVYAGGPIRDVAVAQTVYGPTGTVQPNWFAGGFRLPTEAEWEYAVRGGEFPGSFDNRTDTPWAYRYAGSNTAPPVAQHGDGLKQVGGKSSNSRALFDMSGNVEEWCWDRFYPNKWERSTYKTDKYLSDATPDVGPYTAFTNTDGDTPDYRIARGGSHSAIPGGNPDLLLVRTRRPENTNASSLIGFRVARSL
jgi:formylglycine-generating enzyme required for sulfatase activity